jgi:type II secretory pathway component HofQ
VEYLRNKHKSLIAGLFILLCIAVIIPTLVSAEPEKSNSDENLVTATFFDSDLRESLKEIALQTKVNILVDETVKGLITMDVKNVPLEKVLRMMLIGGGYSYHKVEDFYVVGLPDPKNPAFTGLCDFSVYYFHNISIDSAKALLPTVYEPYVKFDSDKNCANIIAPPELLKIILDDFKKIDGERKQIKIKALVTEIRSDVLKQWGIDVLKWGDLPANYTHSTALDITNGAITINGQSDAKFIFASIKALVNENKATIHADPVLVVTEGKTGDLFVGDRRTLILQSQGTNASTSSTENVEAGTTLKVTPKLFNDQIELTIGQKVSNFDDEGRTDQILVRTQEFNSVIRFAPGQTVMVAGMTGKQNNNSVSKTPLLGDIPLIRLFFRQKSDQKSDSELLVFLTAEVMN